MSRPEPRPAPVCCRAVTPHLVVRGAARAIEFYGAAFGAVELSRIPTSDGRLMYAEIRIGPAAIRLSDEFPESGALIPQSPPTLGGASAALVIESDDTDALFARAVAAGAAIIEPPKDKFWGDRFAKVVDPFGHHWSLATRRVKPPADHLVHATEKWLQRKRRDE